MGYKSLHSCLLKSQVVVASFDLSEAERLNCNVQGLNLGTQLTVLARPGFAAKATVVELEDGVRLAVDAHLASKILVTPL